MKVAGNLITDQSRRDGKGRGESKCEDKGGEGGSGKLARGKEGIWIRELEGGGGGRQVTWGRVLLRDYKRAIILKVTK